MSPSSIVGGEYKLHHFGHPFNHASSGLYKVEFGCLVVIGVREMARIQI